MKCIRGFEKHGKLSDLKYDEIACLGWPLMNIVTICRLFWRIFLYCVIYIIYIRIER